MKKLWILIGIAGLSLSGGHAIAADNMNTGPGMQMGRMMGGGMHKGAMMGKGMKTMVDERQSAGIPEQMKVRQKARMRLHLEAVRDIIDAIAAGNFELASETATKHLTMRKGKDKQMKKMCTGVDPDFKAIGMGFHESGAQLAEVLRQGDTKKSLMALSNTMNYCIQCHATYRQ